MMNYDEAKKVAEDVRRIGGFSKVEVDHHGAIDGFTPEVMSDGRWVVRLWSVNAKAGNRTLYTIEHAPAVEKELKLLIKVAKGKATERDRQALGRMQAEKEMNA